MPIDTSGEYACGSSAWTSGIAMSMPAGSQGADHDRSVACVLLYLGIVKEL